MTSTYTKFLEQFNSKGREKADGYDKSHFDGLTDKEKDLAFELLSTEYISPKTIDWMHYICPEKTVKFSENKINRDTRISPGIHRIYFFLYKKTKNIELLRRLIEAFPQIQSSEKNEVIWMIKRSDMCKNEKLDFYKKVITEDHDRKAISSAADFFLVESGVQRKTASEKNDFYISREILETGSTQQKLSIINKILTK